MTIDLEGMRAADRALMQVVEAVRAYLPPDGIEPHEFISRVIEAIDNPQINPIIKDIENGRS